MLQQQPSPWSCLPTAFAIVTSTRVEDLLFWLGHDDARGFHPQECIEWALGKGWLFVQIDRAPMLEHGLTDFTYKNFEHWLTFNCVLSGETLEGKPHAVAWCAERGRILDPNFSVYPIERFKADTLWIGFDAKRR